MATQYTQPQRRHPLLVLENEQQARAGGRAFAKQIFGRMQWKRIGSKSDEHAKLYESVVNGTPASDGKYTVRAVRQVAATISEIEVVLATAARYGALRVLLPGTYSSGAIGIEYGQVLHATGEREHVSVEYASLRPYAGILGMDHHVLLSYSLATMLQRTRKSRSGQTETVSVPSVLHLLRPVDFPDLTKKRRDYHREYLSLNDLSITYIIQESSKPGMVTLEVVLACTDEELLPAAVRASAAQRKGAPTQKQRMYHDALSLTRVQQLVENYRKSRAGPSSASHASSAGTAASSSSTSAPSQPQTQTQPKPSSARPTARPAHSTPSDAPQLAAPASSGCCICHKRFGPFRWKRHCEVCERAACDRCLSVIANPTATRKKKRVCNNCLYGPNGLGAQQHAAASVETAPAATARPTSTTTTTAGRTESRAAPPVPEYDRSSKRYAARASRTSSRSNSVYSGSDTDDDDVVRGAIPPVRARRAQTLTIDEVACTPVVERTKSFRMTPSYRSSVSRPQAPAVRLTTLLDPDLCVTSSASSYRERLQLHQLKTLDADYDLDFNWLNIFPKAPVPRYDGARVQFLNSVVQLDPHAIVFLRHDAELETLAHRVLDVATQWHGCSINVAGKSHVYCLLNASSELDAASSSKPAVVVDDVMPRNESASSYAVYHNAPFFVAELASDERFRAHPLCTDHGAVSFMSFPIYATAPSAAASRVPYVQCMGTLDLWKLDCVAASSHVSHDWWQKMNGLVREIGARIEALAAESSSGAKLRTGKAYSVDASSSSCDSRNSTRHDDSFELDLFELDGDGGVSGSPASMGVSEDSAEDAFYVKLNGAAGIRGNSLYDSRSWRFGSFSSVDDNSDNESTTSSSSRTSRSSRYSQQRYSAADLHSAIESLLHQANETSSMVYNSGVQI